MADDNERSDQTRQTTSKGFIEAMSSPLNLDAPLPCSLVEAVV